MNDFTRDQAASRYAVARYLTPLRYPGGKQRLGRFFEHLMRVNSLEGPTYIEPFAGGAGAAMHLLAKGLVRDIHLNDVDRSIYAFWYSVTRRNGAIRELVRRQRITVTEWDRQKEVQRNKSSASLLELGFSTLFLNRTNRSGILRGGIIGGRAQSGRWRMDARFNKDEIQKRIEFVGHFSRKITLSNSDIRAVGDLTFGRALPLVYFDPPYYNKGRDLYVNHFSADDHTFLAERIRKLRKARWVVTYDDVSQIRRLYKGLKTKSFNLSYTADRFRVGSELMIFSNALEAPRRVVG